MILSDRTIREELKAGRIVIEPLGDGCIQPSSVDLHLDRYFRVFLNHTLGHIDPKDDLENLTELVEVPVDGAFVLHPGEFVLGSTRERVALPDDLVARLEGKSSLGRLGLLIHSSLPACETVLVRHQGRLEMLPIGDIVRKSLAGDVAAFDPATLRVGFHAITGWYEGPPDKIYEIHLRSGRSVRVTAGHNLFTLNRAGEVVKVRTCQLGPGARVAIPSQVPDPVSVSASPVIDVAGLVPEDLYEAVTVTGPTVAGAFRLHRDTLAEAFAERGSRHLGDDAQRPRLPMALVAQIPGLVASLTGDDRIGWKGGRHSVPARITVVPELAWLLGLYVAEGCRRRQHAVWSDTDPAILDRAESALADLGLPVDRARGAVTCRSVPMSRLLDWIGTGGKADRKRVPPIVYGWPRHLIEAFLAGLVDGAGSIAETRTLVWTSSEGLATDLLTLAPRLGRRASCSWRGRGPSRRAQVQLPHGEHKTLERLVEGDLLFDVVEAVIDTGVVEPIFDLEVRPNGAKVENFVAGSGGVLVSNTAGFVDAGWDGHLTLELSNVLNLPIKLYPGMKIGQISFLTMTTEAEMPYGSSALGSKYQGQRGPTPSRYWENFGS